ncbi:ABC transporter permease subunit [Halodesulfovibrio sp.]|uniref:PstC family ABC transporter permease n=1 Tax=Halodesulfovibrio sp. TaxID=1912772 RepID=UPI0034443F3A
MTRHRLFNACSFWPVLCRCSAVFSVAVVGSILFFLLYFCVPLFDRDTLSKLLTWDWRPFQGHFGILPMIAGSFFLSISALILAFPVSLGICCFVHGMGAPRLGSYALRLIKLMTSIPTVVYGFVGVFVLIPLIRDVFQHGSGFSWIAATIGLAVLILPTIVLMLHTQFSLIESQVSLTASALGMTTAQRLLYLVIPASRKGFIAAAVLGYGRAVGDTMIPLMLAGNAPQLPESFFDSLRTMSAHIALVVAADTQSLAYLSLFACGLFLFLNTIFVNVGLRILMKGSEQGV